MQDASGVEEVVRRAHRTMERLENLAESRGNSNTTVVKLDGQGPLWGMLAVGVALGAAIACTVWVAATLIRQDSVAQQGEAYKRAVYMLAPRFAEEIDKELDRQREREREQPNPDNHTPADAGSKP